jgi:enoyl-CoA hydratase/carnithine racemase
MTPDILCERDGPIATVTLFNPDRLNAVTAAMWRRLKAVMDELSVDEALRCVILRGEGRVFAAGGDLEEFPTQRDTFERAQVYHGEWVAGALAAVAECRHPTVAAIEGPCIGGGLEIAAACDLRIAGEGSRFGAPIMKLGFAMYAGELAGLLALAGAATTLEILLEGRILTAREACEKRLITRVVGDADVQAEALATASRIAGGAPLAARAHKRLVRRLTAAARELSAAELRENFAFLESTDYREGLAAFFDKRPPRFTGA